VFQSTIKGLTQIDFPINIAISGSPIIVPPNQVGLNYKTNPPTLAMPTIVEKSQKISKTFKIKNTGIKDVVIGWKLFNMNDIQEQEGDIFKISIGKNTMYDSREMPYKMLFTATEPEVSHNSAFAINPE
jgi:hypothetical protein